VLMRSGDAEVQLFPVDEPPSVFAQSFLALPATHLKSFMINLSTLTGNDCQPTSIVLVNSSQPTVALRVCQLEL
jgi:hypothetical protein